MMNENKGEKAMSEKNIGKVEANLPKLYACYEG